MHGSHRTRDEVILCGTDPGHGHICCGATIDGIQPNGGMRQCHALHFWDSAGVSHSDWKTAHASPVLKLTADHVHCQPLVGPGQDLQTLALLIVVLHRSRHAVHKIMLFVLIHREKDSHAFVHLCCGSHELAFLELVLVVVVFHIGFVVKQRRPHGFLATVLEEGFHGQLVHLGARSSAAGQDGSVLVFAVHLHYVVGRGIVCLPGSATIQHSLKLLHRWLGGPKDVQEIL